MTKFVQSIDSWPAAVVGAAVALGVAWVIVTFIKSLGE